MIKVKVKEKHINNLNHLLKLSFEKLPFLFKKNEIYNVDEINQALLISSYNRELEFCIEGYNMRVQQTIVMYDLTFTKMRRIFFSEEVFTIVK